MAGTTDLRAVTAGSEMVIEMLEDLSLVRGVEL